MAISTPMVNAPFLSIQGLRVAWTDATHITVAAGRARNSSNLNDIVLPGTITINSAHQGAAGIDIGALANNEMNKTDLKRMAVNTPFLYSWQLRNVVNKGIENSGLPKTRTAARKGKQL